MSNERRKSESGGRKKKKNKRKEKPRNLKKRRRRKNKKRRNTINGRICLESKMKESCSKTTRSLKSRNKKLQNM